MDIAIGDEFSLKVSAFDLKDQAKIVHPAGTIAKVLTSRGPHIILEWPDKTTEPIELGELLVFFNRVYGDLVVLTQQTTGYGTPPPGLAPFLPKEADWRHNYRMKVIIELEDRGLKTAVCPRCLVDLGPELNINTEGLKECRVCNTFVLSIDPLKYEEKDTNNEDESRTLPGSGELGSIA